jgi:AcrR family transcriptional regulator
MARPKSEDKRNAIMAAAIRVIAAQGLAAPTATIAREAGVANGSLFNYFETKADLVNQLYLELKLEVMAAALDGLPTRGALREQAFHVWHGWMQWAVANPDKRRALALLGVSDEITPAYREKGHQAGAGIAQILERARANGPLRDQPMPFFMALAESLSCATMDYMIEHPDQAEQHSRAGFEALWRAMC